MKFTDWEPVYAAILADFGFDRRGDERVRDRFAELLEGEQPLSLTALSFDGDDVAIAGAAPTLEAEAAVAADADAVVAASSAAPRLQAVGVTVDCVVTDLDGTPAATRRFAAEGTPVAVHAHGDNGPAIDEWVPRLDSSNVLPTTQAAPVGPLHNVGGFTDGDRAAFLADHCGAASLVFPGWDFEDDGVDAMKARKLAWAERLLHWLERRRGERFSLIDGRRDDIDVEGLPLE